jgi:hypothetical protein
MESYLQRKGWTAVAIHGDKGQADRSRALQQFRDGTIPLLVSNAATLCLLGFTWIWARLVSRTGPPLSLEEKRGLQPVVQYRKSTRAAGQNVRDASFFGYNFLFQVINKKIKKK